MLTSKDLKEIKEEYLDNNIVFLCNVALELNMIDRFQEYLFDNLDNTMMRVDEQDLQGIKPCWGTNEIKNRLNWLNKHINKLEDYENSRKDKT